MKILHVIPVYEPAWQFGGPVRSVSQLCRGLVKQGFDVSVYTTKTDGGNNSIINSEDEIELGGVRVHRFPLEFGSNFFYSSSLMRSIYRDIRNYDLVHITSIWNYPGLPAAKAARMNNIPYLFSTRGSFIPFNHKGVWFNSLKKSIYYRLLLAENINKSSALHFTNKMEYKLSLNYIDKKIPAFVVPNGINIDEFNQIPTKNNGENWLGISSSNNFIISYLGRLHPRKGLDVLIQAFKNVNSIIKNAHLVLGGPDEGSEIELRNLSKQLGIENKVHFTGLIGSSERLLLFAASDIFVLAGYAGENFGVAVVEAMAARIPVVVSNNVWIFKEIEDYGAGLVTPVTAEGIASAILKIFSNQKLRDSMQESAYRCARERYDKQLVARKMAIAYEDILRGVRSPDSEWID